MLFVDIEFPRRIALGAQRRVVWKTALAQTGSGRISVNQDWEFNEHHFDVSFAVRTADDYATIVEHFNTIRGRFKKFPFRDVLDYRVEASNGEVVDTGDSPSGYQLKKRYGTGADAYYRPITRPLNAVIYRLRGGTTTVITGSSTISTTTGMVTFTGGTVIPGDVLSWSGQFNVPSRYGSDELPGLVVNRRPGTVDYDDLLVQCDAIPIVEVRE